MFVLVLVFGGVVAVMMVAVPVAVVVLAAALRRALTARLALAV